ncbi:hypothetical protein HRI_004379600 [Hibiscus trionum]|uniref:Gnk2-homologous domain-containing protein n=1 Tax=Hibiscus trionum TaxID=183268 RepID=A0A9W7MM16_HIBTR|nr:hypothetical protein HRI_004379600 [Hibiscus trionum]
MIGLLLFCSNVTSAPNTRGDHGLITSLAYVLEDLEVVTSKRQGHDCFNVSSYPNAFAYGHAARNQNLTTSNCATCLVNAKVAMFGTCQNRIESRLVLHDCTIRYEQYAFDD